MASKDILLMSKRELSRLKVIESVLKGSLRQAEAAKLMGVCDRQVRRILDSVKREGEDGVIHRLRGRSSNRRICDKVRKKTLGLYEKKYEGFGPTMACEKLMELDGISVSRESLRQWLLEAGLWKKTSARSSHRQWRPRKECFGEMVQMDGSHHDWLEGRGPKLVLMGYVDDATNEGFGRFYEYEGTLPAMESFKLYSERYGLPMSVYLDRHSTYKSTKKLPPGVEDEEKPLSQFERALEELGVEVIHAYSPQAKGRVERFFGVLQDRLVKEMRLAKIKTKDEANRFLESYWPSHNRRFRVCAANSLDVHIKAGDYDLERYLCIKTQRVVANDYTITHRGKLYQLLTKARIKRVWTEERTDGSLYIVSGKELIPFTEITNRPIKTSTFYNQPSGWL